MSSGERIGREKYRITIVFSLIIIILSLFYYNHLKLKTHHFSHFLYLPISISSLYWRRKGLLVTFFIAAAYLLIHYLTGNILTTLSIIEDFTRISMFFIVSLITIELSKRIQESISFNKMLLDTIPFPLDIVDEEGNLLYANQALEKLVGKEAIGKKCWEVCNDNKAQCFACPLKDGLEAGQTKSIEVSGALGGKMFNVLHVGVNYKDKKAVIESFIDITESKKTQMELAKDKEWLEGAVNLKSAELKDAERKLNEAKRLSDIGTLAATIAHELRNPLGVIKTAVYNIKYKNKDPALEKNLVNIDKKIMESDQIIENLLSYSKISVPRLEEVLCSSILSEVLEKIGQKYYGWDVRVATSCNYNSKDFILADKVQMQMLYFNIMDNAFQALPDNRGTITLTGNYNNKENIFVMFFKDNGIGIDEEDMAKLFNPFFSKKARGIGLGLALCKQIVTLHGGTITINSKRNEGTEVIVSLPIRRKA